MALYHELKHLKVWLCVVHECEQLWPGEYAVDRSPFGVTFSQKNDTERKTNKGEIVVKYLLNLFDYCSIIQTISYTREPSRLRNCYMVLSGFFSLRAERGWS